MTTTKARILINVAVDTDAWCDNYGTEPSEVAEDVQRYIANMVRQQLSDIGVVAR